MRFRLREWARSTLSTNVGEPVSIGYPREPAPGDGAEIDFSSKPARRENKREGRSMHAIHIEHVAVFVRDLEGMRQFYVAMLGARSGARYENPRTGFRSYFISFTEGSRLELMSRPTQATGSESAPALFGYAHIALRLGTRAAVDETVARLEAQGVVVSGRPRQTGDGYYEAVVEDPEGNKIELVE